MKKSFKKLLLSRETLGALDRTELKTVAGGTETSVACIIATGCECQTETGCIGPSWEHTCTVLCCSSMAHC